MRNFVRLLLLSAGFAGLTTTLPGEIPCCELRYRIEPDPATGAVDVVLEIHGFDGDTLELARPSDRPLTGLLGSDPRVEGFRSTEWRLVEGAPRWRYPRPEAGWDDVVRVRYRLAITAERPLNAWSVGLDRTLLYAPAEALFLVPNMSEQAARHASVHVRWALPPDWEAFTGWSGDRFHGVRTLLKTNVLAGELSRHAVDACGMRIEVGVHGEWSSDPDEIVSDLGRLACAAIRRLGDPGVDRYAVTLVQARFPMTSGNRNGPRSIGIVHSVPDGAPPSVRLLAHELVHLWQKFDAPAWFQEGVNDYLALRLAREAGLYDETEYRAQLAAIDTIYRAHPMRDRWSFADEAREAPPFGSSDAYLAYRKGALVGLALDRELRLRTGGEIEVARLWREMNVRAGWGHVRWSDEDLARRAGALTGGTMDHFFERWVHGTDELGRPETMLATLPPLPPGADGPSGFGVVAAFFQTTLGRLAH